MGGSGSWAEATGCPPPGANPIGSEYQPMTPLVTLVTLCSNSHVHLGPARNVDTKPCLVNKPFRPLVRAQHRQENEANVLRQCSLACVTCGALGMSGAVSTAALHPPGH
jgi:hypothetical protein